jgi:hypothetical protein
MTPTGDIQGNSWNDEPEIPSSRRDSNKQMPDSDAAPTLRQGPKPAPSSEGEEPAAVQRPPSDS